MSRHCDVGAQPDSRQVRFRALVFGSSVATAFLLLPALLSKFLASIGHPLPPRVRTWNGRPSPVFVGFTRPSIRLPRAVEAQWQIPNVQLRARARTQENAFDVLDLELDCTDADVRVAFRKKAKVYHPDVPGTGDTEIFQSLLAAAKQLSTLEGRQAAERELVDDYKADAVLENDRRAWAQTGAIDEFDEWFDEEEMEPERRQEAVERAVQEDRARRALLQEWVALKKARKRRRLKRGLRPSRRPRLFDEAAEADEETPPVASEETWLKMRKLLAKHLEAPEAFVAPDSTLVEVGFYSELASSLVDLLMAVESEFDIELADVTGNEMAIKFDMPATVLTCGDLANFVESALT